VARREDTSGLLLERLGTPLGSGTDAPEIGDEVLDDQLGFLAVSNEDVVGSHCSFLPPWHGEVGRLVACLLDGNVQSVSPDSRAPFVRVSEQNFGRKNSGQSSVLRYRKKT